VIKLAGTVREVGVADWAKTFDVPTAMRPESRASGRAERLREAELSIRRMNPLLKGTTAIREWVLDERWGREDAEGGAYAERGGGENAFLPLMR